LKPKIGLLGGTFDPVHHGHLVAAQEAHYQLALDRILFVPAGQPPHKSRHPISAAHHRLQMLERAIAGQSHFAISRVDLERPGPHYTVETLELLRAELGPEPTFVFIEGADSLAEMLTWYRPRRLIELCELAVVGRPGVEIDYGHLQRELPGLEGRLHRVQMPCLEISSSELRARVQAGQPISFLVPPAVEAYIYEQGLYRS